ncbi:GntR family transcriptional regulator [Antarctobacter sp.]|uniref:GntR family transcriptional regulator n=1 Tax=Antarctobacter sp. TaxID=1872577 RepID=UPI003A94C344
MFSVVVDAVQSHRLLPGDRVVERELADVARVNRQAIRNGLLRLANAGLVETLRNKGARIAQLTEEEALQVFEARIVIETALLKALAHKFDDKARAALQDIVSSEAAAYDAARIEEARHLSRRFHMEVGHHAGNKFMSRYLDDLINCQPLLLSFRGGKASQFSGNELHIKTLGALARGDGDEAAHYNHELLSALRSEMLRDINAKKAEDGETSTPA